MRRAPDLSARQVEALVAGAGFAAFGWLTPSMEDLAAPPVALPGARSLLLVGNAGDGMWRRFSSESAGFDNSLDEWCRAGITRLADLCAAKALFPFDRPHLPFQRWAVQTGAFFSSPLGLTIHRDYGLWHAFRGALLFNYEIPWQRTPAEASPCDSCATRPCLSACPVNAFSPGGYDVPSCVGHITTADTKSCSQSGCAARRACPVGSEYQYTGDQAAFHMAAFKAAFG